MAYLLAAICLFAGIFYLQQRGMAQERAEWASERSRLLDRIQRPEMQGFPEIEVSKQFASIDDDAELIAAHEDLNG